MENTKNPYKIYCGECFTTVVIDGDTSYVEGWWMPIEETEENLNISPGNKQFPTPEKFTPIFHEPFKPIETNQIQHAFVGIHIALCVIYVLLYSRNWLKFIKEVYLFLLNGNTNKNFNT